VDTLFAIHPPVVLSRQFLARGVPRRPNDLFQQLNIDRRFPPAALGQGRDAARFSPPDDPAQQRPRIQLESRRHRGV
jgi:hypothetical protein